MEVRSRHSVEWGGPHSQALIRGMHWDLNLKREDKMGLCKEGRMTTRKLPGGATV